MKNKALQVITVIMGILLIFYIATLAMPHMEYSTVEHIASADGQETKLEKVDKEMSIMSLLSFPDRSKNNAVKEGVQEQFGIVGYTVNDATTGPLLLILIAVLGAVVAFLQSKKFVACLLPLAWSIYGFFVYFTNAYVKLGGADYWVQISFFAVVGVLALLVGLFRLPGVIAERKQIRMEIRITKEKELEMQRAREVAENK